MSGPAAWAVASCCCPHHQASRCSTDPSPAQSAFVWLMSAYVPWLAYRLFKGVTPLWGRQIPYTMMKFGESTASQPGSPSTSALPGATGCPGDCLHRLVVLLAQIAAYAAALCPQRLRRQSSFPCAS